MNIHRTASYTTNQVVRSQEVSQNIDRQSQMSQTVEVDGPAISNDQVEIGTRDVEAPLPQLGLINRLANTAKAAVGTAGSLLPVSVFMGVGATFVSAKAGALDMAPIAGLAVSGGILAAGGIGGGVLGALEKNEKLDFFRILFTGPPSPPPRGDGLEKFGRSLDWATSSPYPKLYR